MTPAWVLPCPHGFQLALALARFATIFPFPLSALLMPGNSLAKSNSPTLTVLPVTRILHGKTPIISSLLGITLSQFASDQTLPKTMAKHKDFCFTTLGQSCFNLFWPDFTCAMYHMGGKWGDQGGDRGSQESSPEDVPSFNTTAELKSQH